jgi:hypothetical protein
LTPGGLEVPPFGGIPGKWVDLEPDPTPPEYGYRVISADIWKDTLLPGWKDYLGAPDKTHVTPPTLAPTASTGVYFTDELSLQGAVDPKDFADRVELTPTSCENCGKYGCVVIKFKIQDPSSIEVPNRRGEAAVPGLTSHGAREWRTIMNVYLDAQMEVHLIERTRGGRYRHRLVALDRV